MFPLAVFLALRGPLPSDPPLTEVYWLPSLATAEQACRFNESYRECLRVARPLSPANAAVIDEALDEAGHLGQVWDTIVIARSESETETNRRRALARLRQLIGPEAFCRCELPPPVPVRRCQVIEP